MTVEVDELGEKVVRAHVYVETESQKGILVGKKGAMVREIGVRARPEVEALVGHPVSSNSSSRCGRGGAATRRCSNGSASDPGSRAEQLERRIVSVLFCDLAGFTSLSERLDPEDVATVQGAYLKPFVTR